MNTKSILIFALLLTGLGFKFSTKVAIHNSIKMENSSANNSKTGHAESDKGNSHNEANMDMQATKQNDYNHSGDDDCKTHHFHFNRYDKRKCRIIYCLVGKIILLITHLSSLLMIIHFLSC